MFVTYTLLRDRLGFNIETVGNGFLYNMVRIIAGTLLEVGEGRISPNAIEDIIKTEVVKMQVNASA